MAIHYQDIKVIGGTVAIGTLTASARLHINTPGSGGEHLFKITNSSSGSDQIVLTQGDFSVLANNHNFSATGDSVLTVNSIAGGSPTINWYNGILTTTTLTIQGTGIPQINSPFSNRLQFTANLGINDTPSTSYAINALGDTYLNGNVIVTGSFSVFGSASVINTTNLSVQDPLILLANTQSGTPTLDQGILFKRGTGATQAFIWDESDGKFVFVETNSSDATLGNVVITSSADVRAKRYYFYDNNAPQNPANSFIYAPDGGSLGINTTTLRLYSNTIDTSAQNIVWAVGANTLEFTNFGSRSFKINQDDNGLGIPSFTMQAQSSGSSGNTRTGLSFSHTIASSVDGSFERAFVIEQRDTGTYSGTAVGLTIDMTAITNSNRAKYGLRILDGSQGNGNILVSNANGYTSWTYSLNAIKVGTTELAYGNSTNGGLTSSSRIRYNNGLIVTGVGTTSQYALSVNNSAETTTFGVRNDGVVHVGQLTPTALFHVMATNSATSSFAMKIDNSSSSPLLYVRNDGNVGVNVLATASTALLHVKNVTGTTSNTAVFRVEGNSGELFTISDSLTGSLFSVNDISGLPVIEAFDDSSILMGNYSAPSLYTTKKVNLGTGSNTVYNFATATYSGAFFEYVVTNATASRAGTFMSVWNGTYSQYTDTPTSSIGDTTPVTMSVSVSGSTASFIVSATTSNWVLKTIIRSI